MEGRSGVGGEAVGFSPSLTVGVVIPTRNRQGDLVVSVRSWLDQDIPISEVVVVESGNLEGTRRALEDAGLGDFVELVGSLPGLPRQRNEGFRHARADILFLADDDLTPEASFARVLVSHFVADGEGLLGAAGGMIDDRTRLPGRAGQWVRRFFGLSRIGEEGRMQRSGFGIFPLARGAGVIPVEVLPGTCLAVRRSVYPELKFDEYLEGYALMEDVDFTFRLGRKYRMVFDPSVTAVHHAAPAGRHSRRDYCAMMVVNYCYLFKKNCPGGPMSMVSHFWALVGLWIYWGLLVGLKDRSLSPLRGLARGTGMVLRGEMWPAADHPAS